MYNNPWPKTSPILWVYDNDLETAKQEAFRRIELELCANDSRSKDYFKAGTHPDFRMIESTTANAILKIETIRLLNEWLLLSPILATRKIVLVISAENLNTQAANAFLKTLEEAPESVQIILLTKNPALVLPTVRSRCVLFKTTAIQKKQHITDFEIIGSTEDASSFLKDLFYKLWQHCTQQATQGTLIQDPPYWAFVDKIIQTNQFLSEGAPLNKILLMDALSAHYIAYTNTNQK